MAMEQLRQLLIVYAAYVIATASPGPSNMAIMGMAMSKGRASALLLALGVISGSLFWAILAATGISAVLATYAEALFVIKVLGGFYLLYLAYKAAKSAWSGRRAMSDAARAPTSKWQLYRRGLLLHLTNPKAVLAWIAIMSLGLGPNSSASTLVAIVLGCAVLSILVFGGYAIVFSTLPMIRAYLKARRWIEGVLAAAFGYAGIRLLLLQL